jgi:signal peptidase I, bacterial type
VKKRSKAETQEVQVQENITAQEPSEKAERTSKWREILTFVVKVCCILLIGYILLNYVFGVMQMNGETMYPRLRDGDAILYYRLDKDFHMGDVVVYDYRGISRVARVIAQGGDVIDLSENGEVLINGLPQMEEIFYPTEKSAGGIKYPYTVEEGSYFLMVDYRTIGSDSRDLGGIPAQEILGKVVTILRRRGI